MKKQELPVPNPQQSIHSNQHCCMFLLQLEYHCHHSNDDPHIYLHVGTKMDAALRHFRKLQNTKKFKLWV